MKRVLYFAVALLLSVIALNSCVKDNLYQGKCQIESVNYAPKFVNEGDAVTVTAFITYIGGGISADLVYSAGGAAEVTVPMTGAETGGDFVGVIPAVVIGLLAKKSGLLDWLLDSVEVVAVMLVLGGVFMLYCDKIFNKGSDANKVTEKRAFNIGLFQCISVIPGVSRSMATIVGGMAQGLTRKRAAEFSFFLAVPTMAGATLLDLLDLLKDDAAWATSHNITMLILGCVVAFIVALLAMKWFVSFLSKYGFKAFGIYRIIVGGIIIILLLTGHSLAMVD